MVFVRMQGCNLIIPCNFCDTLYARDASEGTEMSVDEVVAQVSKLSPYHKSWVCITGGEPLWQEKELELLVRELRKGGYKVTIETNGSFNKPSWYSLVDSWCTDMKCPCSGICGVSKEDWFYTRTNDQIKFVVGALEDLEFVKDLLNKHKTGNATVLISPVTGILIDKPRSTIEEYWNREWLQEVVEFCKEIRVRFSLQWHKVVWGDKRGV